VALGLDGSRAIWLIALHNYDYKGAGKLVLNKMRRLYYRNRASVFYPGIPYLADRIMLAEKGFDHSAKQLYGTQGWLRVTKRGRTQKGAYPIANPKGLHERRRRFGLTYDRKSSRHCKHTN
jgi:hypothetical protein